MGGSEGGETYASCWTRNSARFRKTYSQIEALSVERLDEIILAILDAKSLDELGLTA